MKKLFTLTFFSLTISFLFAQNFEPEIKSRLKGVDAELEEVLKTWNAAGFAVAVVAKNEIVYAKGFGYRDYENKLPATENTLFAIGSCSKAFTSSILGQLRNENELDFEESPRKYVPELNFFNSEMNSLITIKDLMCHRTGLPRHDFSWYLFPTDSKEELIKRIEFQEPFAGIRTDWYYNNFMFLTQGVIAEKITGKTWEENVRDNIFKPLGMKSSNLSLADWKKATEPAIGYELTKEDKIKKTDYYDIAGMSPAGSINSSVHEMGNWLKVWINGGKFNGEEILSADYVAEAMGSQMVIGTGLPGKEHPNLHFATYGYGWFSASYKGHYRVEHGGNIDGFSASTSFFPSDSVGIVVLVNQDGSSVPAVVRNIIADRILDVEKSDWNKELFDRRQKAKKAQEGVEQISNKKEITRPSHNLIEFAGKYANSGYGEFEIKIENDSMFAQFPIEKIYLNHHHYNVFKPFLIADNKIDTVNTIDIYFNFQTNNLGEISGMNSQFEQALSKPIEFKRTPTIIKMDEATLAKYVGSYELAGMTAKVYTKKDDTLYLFITGQPEYELLPTGNHKFAIKILDGFKLEFHEDAEKAISEISFIQPNGTFKAVRK